MRRQLNLITIFIIFISSQANAEIDQTELKCLVCQKSIEELSHAVRNIDPHKKVDIGGYRLDPDGNYQRKTVPQAKSEVHLSELVENICEKMDDYVRATRKTDGKLVLLQLLVDGKMNSDMSSVDIIQDDDLNKSVKYNCEGIMEEFEEDIIKHIQNDVEDIATEVCYENSGPCQYMERDEL